MNQKQLIERFKTIKQKQRLEQFKTMDNYHIVEHKDKVQLFLDNQPFKKFNNTLEAMSFAISFDKYKMNNKATDIYYAIQKGYRIFGRGDTPAEAWLDAKEWLDKDSPLQSISVEGLPSYACADDGNFCIVEFDDYKNGDK